MRLNGEKTSFAIVIVMDDKIHPIFTALRSCIVFHEMNGEKN
jgi:hypothetical protein